MPNVFVDAGLGVLTAVVIANSFQLTISFLYLFYNTLLTSMLMAHEIALFCETTEPTKERDFMRLFRFLRRPKSGPRRLRTIFPLKGQEGAYFLTIQFSYAIPLMAIFALLHFLVSRSIFLVQVHIYDNTGALNPSRTISSCGVLVGAMVCSIMVGAVMLLPLYALSCRHLPARTSVMSSCSVAISAACHPGDGLG